MDQVETNATLLRNTDCPMKRQAAALRLHFIRIRRIFFFQHLSCAKLKTCLIVVRSQECARVQLAFSMLVRCVDVVSRGRRPRRLISNMPSKIIRRLQRAAGYRSPLSR